MTVWRGAAYIRLTNEGGAPLAAKKFALVERFQESRVSDLCGALRRKRTGLRHRVLRCLFFDN